VANPLGEQPVAHFQEETIVTIGDQTFHKLSEGIWLNVDPVATVAVVDVETNLPTGESVTHARLYQLLYSAYLQTALERDAAAVVP